MARIGGVKLSTLVREQARFLRALADHLEQNPELVLHSISTGARLALHVHADATEVVAWARSLGVTELRADSYEDFVSLAAEGTLGDHRVQLEGYSKDLDRDMFERELVQLDDPRLLGGAS